MNRVRILLGLLALFYLMPSFCQATGCIPSSGTYAGQCHYTSITKNQSQQITDYQSVVYSTYSLCFPILVQKGTTTTVLHSGGQYNVITYRWNSTYSAWNQLILKTVYIQDVDYPSVLAAIESNGGGTVSPLTAYPNGIENCGANVCDISDDDSDGVCNSCDTKPGESDPKHCIWTQSVTPTGQVVTMVIDQSGNCDGSQTATYTNSSLSSEKTYWDLGTASQEITAPSCQGDDGTGNCGCDYPKSDSIFTNFEQDTNTELTEDLKEQIQEQKENKDDPNYDDCSNIKARCDAACLSRGGVVTNTCTVSGETTYANCKCKNEYAFDIATPTETTTDTSTGGNVAETGGTDTNADGKADTYAAVKDAIKDSGLTSKIDSTNTHLNSIGNKIDTVGSAINGLGSAVDGVGEGINGLGSAINGVGEGINGLGTKLDTIADKLDNLNDNQDITATGSADLPGNNTYDAAVEGVEEISLADTIGSFISNGLPIVSYFKGSYIDIGSASPAMSTEVFGKTITIDFSGMESVLNSMGLVLVSVSTILSFMIIIRG